MGALYMQGPYHCHQISKVKAVYSPYSNIHRETDIPCAVFSIGLSLFKVHTDGRNEDRKLKNQNKRDSGGISGAEVPSSSGLTWSICEFTQSTI